MSAQVWNAQHTRGQDRHLSSACEQADAHGDCVMILRLDRCGVLVNMEVVLIRKRSAALVVQALCVTF